MSLPPKLETELASLRELYAIETAEDSAVISLVFKGFLLGDGFNVAASDLLVRVPRTYPDAGPDMFWVDQGVKLATGAVPQGAESIETHLGRPWRRFSWHRRGPWNPNFNNMQTYIEFVRRRLREKH